VATTFTLPAIALGVTAAPDIPTRSAEGSEGVPTVVNVTGETPEGAVAFTRNVRLNTVPVFALKEGLPDGA
jgi:hypothetical protein